MGYKNITFSSKNRWCRGKNKKKWKGGILREIKEKTKWRRKFDFLIQKLLLQFILILIFFSGLVVEDAERATIAKDLGPNNKVNCSVLDPRSTWKKIVIVGHGLKIWNMFVIYYTFFLQRSAQPSKKELWNSFIKLIFYFDWCYQILLRMFFPGLTNENMLIRILPLSTMRIRIRYTDNLALQGSWRIMPQIAEYFWGWSRFFILSLWLITLILFSILKIKYEITMKRIFKLWMVSYCTPVFFDEKT